MIKAQVKFSTTNTEFFSTLRKRVDAYFKERNISKHANTKMVVITAVILLGFVGSYIGILSNLFSPIVMLLLAMLNGFCTAQIGVNIAHDAIHESFSKSRKVNKALATLFNVVGANDYVWQKTHNILHHTYTNIEGHDDDINQPGVIRVSPESPKKSFHKFQHLYVFFLYSLASLSWVFVKDFVKFFNGTVNIDGNTPPPAKEVVRLLLYKLVYYTLFLIVPILAIELPWYWVVFGFCMGHVVEGLTLALIFHLAHLVEGTHFPVPNNTGSIENTWAVHQLYTTADFSRDSELANLLCGGLNFQIEHHLFPKICHVHYKELSPIVKETALEFGVPFIENETFFSALQSHYRFMKEMGNSEVSVS